MQTLYNLVQHAPLKDATEVLVSLVNCPVLKRLVVNTVDDRDGHRGEVSEINAASRISFISIQPVNWSQKGGQPVLIDLTVSVEEDNDDSLGLLGSSRAGPDQTLALLVPDQPDLASEDTYVVL